MSKLALVVLLACTACGTDTTTSPTTYSLTGRWVVALAETSEIVGIMHLDAAAGTGYYAEGYVSATHTEGGPIFADVSGLAFAPSTPNFQVDFAGPGGQRAVVGTLLAESNSAVFRGTVNGTAVTGVWSPGP